MTTEEKQKMMEEIMNVVDKHIAKSENKPIPSKEELRDANKYGRQYGISDEKMAAWKEEYRKMRVDTKTVLEEVMRNPIDVKDLVSSFDVVSEFGLIK